MKKFIVALTVASFAFAGTAFSAVNDIKVSGDINIETVSRDLLTGDNLGDQDNSDEFVISQIRLRFDADLTEEVSAVLRLISQETWGEDNADDIEVDLGYIELKEFLYDFITLIVGKQNLRYGSALVVGDPDTNQGAPNDAAVGLPAIATDLSLRKSFDAIRTILDFSPWTVDLVFAQLDENTTVSREDDEILGGVNIAYDWSSYNGVSEFYFFAANKSPRAAVADEENNVRVVGLRKQFDTNDHLTLSLEGAYQYGKRWVATTDRDNINAYAGIASIDYRFLNDYNTKVGLKYTLLSGNKTNKGDDGTFQGWNPMWEDQTPGELLNILMDNSNAQFFTVTASMMPREDITLGLLYTKALLDVDLADGATYGPTLGPASGNAYIVKQSERDFGDEVDVYAIYDYTEDVQIKLSGAYFVPGEVFLKDNNDSAMSIRAGLNVAF